MKSHVDAKFIFFTTICYTTISQILYWFALAGLKQNRSAKRKSKETTDIYWSIDTAVRLVERPDPFQANPSLLRYPIRKLGRRSCDWHEIRVALMAELSVSVPHKSPLPSKNSFSQPGVASTLTRNDTTTGEWAAGGGGWKAERMERKSQRHSAVFVMGNGLRRVDESRPSSLTRYRPGNPMALCVEAPWRSRPLSRRPLSLRLTR